MRSTQRVFHLAIPCANLQDAKKFYQDGLGCVIAREYDDRITVNFFGDQVVCHLAPGQVVEEPKIYPRHFGITFRDKDEYDALLKHARDHSLEFFREPFCRFSGKVEEHYTFFLKDPSNNLLEFKYYIDDGMIY